MASENPRLTWIETAAAALLDVIPFSYGVTRRKRDGKPLLTLPQRTTGDKLHAMSIGMGLAGIDIISIPIGVVGLMVNMPEVTAIAAVSNLAVKFAVLGVAVRHNIQGEL